MSSNPGHCARGEPDQDRSRRESPAWSWPIGVRGLLAGAAVLTAVGQWVTTHHDQRAAASGFLVAPVLVVDPNTAPARVLTALPRVGPSLVGNLLAARDDQPFDSLKDAQNRVRGLGPATIAQIAPHLRFDPMTRRPENNLADSSSARLINKIPSTRRKSTGPKTPRSKSPKVRSKLVAEFVDARLSQPVAIVKND